MKDPIHRIYLGAMAVLLLLLIYVLDSYNDVLSTEIGFIYHPETDRIFAVQLSAWVGHETLSQRLNPFSDVHYGVTGIGEHLGHLTNIIKETSEDELLRKNNYREWLKKHGNMAKRSLEESIDLNFEFNDFAYLIRSDVDRSDDLLKLIPGIDQYIEDPSTHILNIDAYVQTVTKDVNAHDTRILTESLLISGRVAAYLRIFVINDSYMTMVND